MRSGMSDLDIELEYDAGLLWSALLLLAIGLVMVYSASSARTVSLLSRMPWPPPA